VSYFYQSGYFSYLIKVGLGLGEDTHIALALFNLCLLGCQSLGETLLQNTFSFDYSYSLTTLLVLPLYIIKRLRRYQSQTTAEMCRYRSGVNFTNVLRAAFTLVDPESVKKYS